MESSNGRITSRTWRRASLAAAAGLSALLVNSLLVEHPKPLPGASPNAIPTPVPSVITCRGFDIHDGDTFSCGTSSDKIVIRLYGADAPELDQTGGTAARAALARLVDGVDCVLHTVQKDKYGRIVARVDGAGSVNVSLSMVSQGEAWWYSQYAPSDNALRSAEDSARAARVGLWAESSPIAPWIWRHRNDPIPIHSASASPTPQTPIASASPTPGAVSPSPVISPSPLPPETL